MGKKKSAYRGIAVENNDKNGPHMTTGNLMQL